MHENRLTKIIDNRIFHVIVITVLSFGCAFLINLKMANLFTHCKLLYVAAGCISVAAIVIALCGPKKARIFHYIVKYRWMIAGGLFILCVALKLNGSSIGAYNQFLPTVTDQNKISTLFGSSRLLRSDEWGVQTPIFFSQHYNGFQLTSHQMSVSDTNMIIDYYAPTLSVFTLCKPLSWGYVLFGNEIGLSWYWSGMILLLFMVSFELFYIITKKNTVFSIIGMFMIALSPAIQWWVMPHMPIVFLYAMALFCVGYYFFTAKSIVAKIATAVLAVITICGFAMSIFPSCQVPCALVMLALLIGMLIRDRESLTFRKLDILRLAITVLLVILILGWFLLTAKDAILALLNSAYPGARISVGGDQPFSSLFTDLTSFWLPYKDSNVANNCEVATYIQFAPLFLVLFPRTFIFLYRKKDKNYIIGSILFLALLVEIVFMCIGFPEFLAKITLFKYINRMKMIYGWTGTIFTCWGFYILYQYKELLHLWQKILYPILYGAVCFLLLFLDGSKLEYLSLWYYLGEILLFSGLLLFATLGWKKLLCYFAAAIMFFCGGTVNPICCGISAITNHPIYDCVQTIVAEDPDARWLSLDSGFYMSNYLLASGAKVLDATNFYLDTGKWEILGLSSEYEEETNRYSNQCATLTADANSVELLLPDYIQIKLNPTGLKDLNIKYIMATVDYTELLATYSIQCSWVFEQDGYTIYELSY